MVEPPIRRGVGMMLENAILLDSITDVTEEHRGAHLLVGSHGGFATGAVAARLGASSFVCCDAGVGLERSGIAALSLLANYGIPAAAVSVKTARIGDVHDMAMRGRISWANGLASKLGVAPGTEVDEALALLRASRAKGNIEAPDISFKRLVTTCGNTEILLCDSASQIMLSDAGRIVVTGSHGGLPGQNPQRASKAKVALIVFNDAGIGIDNGGISRLPVLDNQAIPACCVDCMTSRIGDAQSTYDNGIVSIANQSAQALGVFPGMSVPELVQIAVSQIAVQPQ